MRISQATMQGFRGFNELQTLAFHSRLTVIYAPNSYGKTSISEAVEWLLYGATSKIEHADSKEEYRGSCRNRHLPAHEPAFVSVSFTHGNVETVYHGTLMDDDGLRRTMDGNEVDRWPIADEIEVAPRPFVLQHTLKHLLLAKPDARFQRFARFLGLHHLDAIQRDVVALCTKPDACVPEPVKRLRREIGALDARLQARPSLSHVAALCKRGSSALPAARAAVVEACQRYVPTAIDEAALVPELLKIREGAVRGIFGERLSLPAFTPQELAEYTSEEESFLGCIAQPLVSKYMQLATLVTQQSLMNRIKLLELGLGFLETTPDTCPLCGTILDASRRHEVHAEHERLTVENKQAAALERERHSVQRTVSQLAERLVKHHARFEQHVAGLLALTPQLDRLSEILGAAHQAHCEAVEGAIGELRVASDRLKIAHSAVTAAVARLEESLRTLHVEGTVMLALGDALARYVAEASTFRQCVMVHAEPVSLANQLLQREVDRRAGIEDVSLLLDMLEHWQDIVRARRIDVILAGLKDLRKTVDGFVAVKMLAAISEELTSDVMEWYDRIRTDRDPDVHFGGFDLDRTAKGSVKARRVQIKATSYGAELVSAVSSLSESKLNALGICMSIAASMRSDDPFEFLVIDDPIQSWDAEHEAQFVDVVRELVERGKQVILLSHNRRWIEQVRVGCRTLNGWMYEISGYSKAGPHIRRVTWEKWEERLKEVDAILKDLNANSVRLQQAEEEIRLVVGELTADVYEVVRGQRKDPNHLNASAVRKLLTECGVNRTLVDRIVQTFTTTDDAHHAPIDYAAHRARISRYHSWAHELARFVKDARETKAARPEKAPLVSKRPADPDAAEVPATADALPVRHLP